MRSSKSIYLLRRKIFTQNFLKYPYDVMNSIRWHPARKSWSKEVMIDRPIHMRRSWALNLFIVFKWIDISIKITKICLELSFHYRFFLAGRIRRYLQVFCFNWIDWVENSNFLLSSFFVSKFKFIFKSILSSFLCPNSNFLFCVQIQFFKFFTVFLFLCPLNISNPLLCLPHTFTISVRWS